MRQNPMVFNQAFLYHGNTRTIDHIATVLPENSLHWKAELPRPFNYLLPGFKTTPESFFSCWLKSTFALSQANPAKLIAVLAAFACRLLRNLLIASLTKRSTVGRCRLPW